MWDVGLTPIDNVKAVILDIVVAGTDTAAAAVVWGMTYLMKYPQVMKNAQAEVRDYMKEQGLTFVTEEDVKNLPYFRALVKETLRIEPVIPLLIPRACIQDTKIAGYDIPAGTTVNVNAWAVSRDEKEWGPNPDEFRPERFLEKEVDFKGTDYEFIPFGSGRRMYVPWNQSRPKAMKHQLAALNYIEISPKLAPPNRRPPSPVTEPTKPTESLVEGYHRIRDDETKPETPSAATADEPHAATRRKKEARDAHAQPRAAESSERGAHAPPPVTGTAAVRQSRRDRQPSVRRRDSAAASSPDRRRRQ
ncbi:unnamed protein product [Arabidopsis lyrata]|nr:unnamed protein product [Arabidopsis lyrata]